MQNNSTVEIVFSAGGASACTVFFLVMIAGYMRTMFRAPGYIPMSTAEHAGALLIMIVLLACTMYNVLKAVYYFNVWYKKHG